MHILTDIAVCIIYISLYGCIRAFISIKLGDKGDQAKARLTLNPRVHIDSIGLLFMLFWNVGFIKPMASQSINFKNRKGANILIATLPTIILFAVSTIIMWVYFYVVYIIKMPNGEYVGVYNEQILPVFYTSSVIKFTQIALGTMIYNLIPIYPLEGERIFNYIVSPNVRFTCIRYDKAFQMLLVALTIFGFLPNVINFISNYYISVFY